MFPLRHRKTRIPLAAFTLILLLVSIFFHFYNLGYEFGNDESIAAAKTIQFLHGLIDPKFFGSIFIYEHPPLRILASVPFVLVFGAREAVMRFPDALFGTASTMLVFLIGYKAFGRNAAFLSTALYAVGGISAVNRQNQGVGIYTFLVLFALYWLLEFLSSTESKAEKRAYALLVLSLFLATYTYLEAFLFYPPVLYFAWKRTGSSFFKQSYFITANLLYVTSIAFYFAAWFVMPVIANRLGYINKTFAGNIPHIFDRILGISPGMSILDVFYQYVSYNSIFAAVLLIAGCILGLIYLRNLDTFRVVLFYFLPHLLVWTFLLQPVVMHPMYDYAFVALAAGAGLGRLFEAINLRNKILGRLYLAAVAVCLVFSGWHNFVVNSQDRFDANFYNLVFWVPSPVHSYIDLGTKTAGYFVRTSSEGYDRQVFSLGTGSASYYAGRLEKNHAFRQMLERNEFKSTDDIEQFLKSSDGWEEVEYLIISGENDLLWEFAQEHYSLEALVLIHDQPGLYIFQTTERGDDKQPVILTSEQYKRAFDEKFGRWQEMLPWFLPKSSERF